ncbi:hypothetical protein [Dyadobacter bucti]|uniref:hypothetical protein n=1 Tax=Dyadobacter bucti TaxID=2572203 RepID=UPI003F6E6E5D
MDLVVYFGKVNLYWVLFYILYCLMLRNHTFFRWNRAYLTGTLVLAFLLPFITFPQQVPIVQQLRRKYPFCRLTTLLPKSSKVWINGCSSYLQSR